MKALLLICIITWVSCSSQKNNAVNVQDTATIIQVKADTSINVSKDTVSRVNTPDTPPVVKKTIKTVEPSKANPSKLPDCLSKLIRRFQEEEVQNPPRKIYSYTYNNKLVYYVTPPCCDFFSDLYNSDCALIAHPDGGITGKGDGRAKDFLEQRKNEKLVWEDRRKYK